MEHVTSKEKKAKDPQALPPNVTYSMLHVTSPRGFTLVEMIVSVAIFSVVMIIAVGALLAVVGANKKAQAMKAVTNNLNFAVESMSRGIRTGYGYSCGEDGCNGSNIFTFTDQKGRQIIYQHNSANKSILRKIDAGSPVAITASEISVERLGFYGSGLGVGDGKHPRVLIQIGGYMDAGKNRETFDIETMVAERFPDS